jgi:competence protein ComEC
MALALAFGAGCATGDALSRTHAILLLAVAAVLLALATATRFARAGGAALLAAALGLGAAAAATQRLEYESASLAALVREDPEEPVRVEGVARLDARERDGRTLLEIALERLNGAPAAGVLRVGVGGDAPVPEILQGQRVSLWATLRAPRGFRDPGVADTRAIARRQGWHATGYCKSSRLVEMRGRARGLLALAGSVRGELRRRLVAFVPAGPEAAVVRAMVLGDRTGLDAETQESFRIAGTYHVLALSGAQIALVAALLQWLLGFVWVPPAWRALLLAMVLAAYAVLVGADVPIVRAALMAVVVLVGRTLDLDSDAANLLGLAALILLVARPGDWADVGFQLSFAATLGLVLLTPPVVALFPSWPMRLELALSTSVAAQLALLPLLALHFHRLAPSALLLNLLAVPLSTGVLLAGTAVLLASVVSASVAGLCGWIAFAAARALLVSGTIVDGLPFLDARLPTPPLACALLHVAAVGALAGGRARLACAGLALAWGGFAVACLVGPRGDGSLSLTVLDVGQGDALVVRSPHGRVLLVDAGGSFDGRLDIGERVLGPFLWGQGIRRIDVLVLTHAHPDHVGGVPFLLKAFSVGEVWEGPRPADDRAYVALDGALRRALPGRRVLARGASFHWDGVTIDVLGPRPRGRPSVVRNDDSLVLRLGFGGRSLLLTGDVEAPGEALLETGRVEILKVAHHGSRTSSTGAFLARARPRVAVVSAGQRNPFGHPHPDVVRRLVGVGAALFRTDRDGAVTVATDGHHLRVETFTLGAVRVQ